MMKAGFFFLSIGLVLAWGAGILEAQGMSKHKTQRKVRDVLKLLDESGFAYNLLQGDNKDQVVVVTPGLVGRVLASGMDGLEGLTDSWLSEEQLRKGLTPSRPNGQWASVGGDERLWLAPESGPHAFFMPQGTKQNFTDYTIPEVMNSDRFEVVDVSADGKSVTFRTTWSLTNYMGTRFDIEVTRQVELLEYCPYTAGLGDQADFVGFESRTWVKNIGTKAWTADSGCVSIWTLGQWLSYPDSVVILPFQKEGPGEAVCTEYFSTLAPDSAPPPANLWSQQSDHLLVSGSGRAQTKMEIYGKRGVGRLAGVDVKNSTLNILDFDCYPRMDYVASYEMSYQGDRYAGGSSSCFVLSDQLGIPPFYELESCSPALFLQPGEQYCHRARTYKIRGKKNKIAAMCKRHFNADWQTLETFNQNAQNN